MKKVPVKLCLAAAVLAVLMTLGVRADEYGYIDENGDYIEYDLSGGDEDEGRGEEYREEEHREEDSGEEEQEFIPESYYEPIQTNEIDLWPEGPMIQAAAGIVMDLDTGTVLYAKNIDRGLYPASITKIMTSLVALKYGNLEDTITCSEEVYNLEEDASHLGFVPGEKVSMEDALYGLMLQSANDLGIAIAEHIGGSIAGFADLMNQEAASVGCENTHFSNPHGLHEEDHYTCARDMALIAAEAYRLDMFRAIIATKESSIPKTNKTKEVRYFLNHHKMIQPDSGFYQEWCTGGKTGFTDEAWNTLVTFGEDSGMRLVCVIMHENGAERAYEETTALLRYGFDNFRHADMTKVLRSPTFYEILGITYPSASKVLERSPALEQRTLEIGGPGMVTIPVNVSMDQVKARTDGNAQEITYTCQGWPIGEASITLTPIPQNITYEYQQEMDMDQLLRDSESERRMQEIRRTAYRTKKMIQNFAEEKVEMVTSYVENNRMTVLLAVGFVLLVLLILIVIVFLRVTRESRIRRRRALEEKTRQRHAQEIEEMSAQEIEEELREAMAQRETENQEEPIWEANDKEDEQA